MNGKEIPRLVFTTDVNGTITPDNTFAELVRPDGHHEKMASLMKAYTSGKCAFSDALFEMKKLVSSITRERIVEYARRMPLFPGVEKTLDTLIGSEKIDAAVAFSTTGFAGLIVLVNKFRFGSRLKAAASDALANHLEPEEKSCLAAYIRTEGDKGRFLDELAEKQKPHPGLIFHVGDSLGDFPGIVHAAEKGGTGIAFCPNEALIKAIAKLGETIRKKIVIITPRTKTGPDYQEVLAILRDAVFRKNGVFI